MVNRNPTAPARSFGSPTTPYDEYGLLDTLHSLQRPRTDVPAERGFIVTTQVMELLFDLLRHEWVQAQQALRGDDTTAAIAALRRGQHVQDVLIACWDLLAALTPTEFSAFRGALGEASGVQSQAYRQLEFLLGDKSGKVTGALRVALHEPSLYDDALALLERRGLVTAEYDVAARYEPQQQVEQAWLQVYTQPEHADLARLGEALLDTAERVTRWRQRHLAVVRRTMGAKPGTGGSSGLDWLRVAAERDVFPELWTVRNLL